MSDTRIMTAKDGDSCACGCVTARVRVRGNAFAVTCVDCRATSIVPMLAERELIEAFGEGDEIVQPVKLRPVSRHIVTSKTPPYASTIEFGSARLGVEFRLPTP